MPELPQERFLRYTEGYKIPQEDAKLIIAQKEFSDFYDEAVKITPEYKLIANLMLGEISHQLNDREMDITAVTFTPANIAKIAEMAAGGVVSKGSAKDIIIIMFDKGCEPEAIAKDNGFIMDNDTSGLDEIIDKVLIEQADAVEKYKNGNDKLFGFIMGQAIKAAGKGANPALIKEALASKLK